MTDTINRRQVYHKEHPTTQTFEKMSNELKNYVVNPEIPSTPSKHREVYKRSHPNEPITPDDLIHHINGNHNDNRIENLLKVDAKTHRRLHVEMENK